MTAPSPTQLTNLEHRLPEIAGRRLGLALLVGPVRSGQDYVAQGSVRPEHIPMALTEGGMPCTVQERLSRFRSFDEERTEGKDSNRARFVVER